MGKNKKLNEEILNGVNGGVSIEQGNPGYYAKYFYSGALEDGSALIKEDIIGPYTTEKEIELQIAIIYTQIRVHPSINDFLNYKLYYKNQNGNIEELGTRIAVD